MVEPDIDIRYGDCIAGLHSLARDRGECVHLTVTSIPFEELFTYSGKTEDVGNNGSTVDIREGRFAINLRFFAEALLAATAPGCNACIHIQQLIAYINQHGFMGRRDFRGAVIDLFRASGWNYVGEWAIPKDPQEMARKLSLHSLQFRTGYARSSTLWAGAVNDFVLVFQKPGEVLHEVQPLDKEAGIEETGSGWLSRRDWIVWAKGVWEIDAFDVLDGAGSSRQLAKLKEAEHEKHVCPLQLEVIRRCVALYANPLERQPDVLVCDPFTGIGSTAWVCAGAPSPHTKLVVPGGARNFVGWELKESYHRAAVGNVERARIAVKAKPDRQRTIEEIAGEQGEAA